MEKKRYRFAVPEQDVSVTRWLESQINISNSIRQLIRECIQKNGYMDVFCIPVEQGPKRGRPSDAELERRQTVQEQNIEPVQDFREEQEQTVRSSISSNKNNKEEQTVSTPQEQEIPNTSSILESLLG